MALFVRFAKGRISSIARGGMIIAAACAASHSDYLMVRYFLSVNSIYHRRLK